MKSIKRLITAVCAVAALGLCSVAHADETVVVTNPPSPFAFNAWAGLAYDYLHVSGDETLSTSDGKLGANFGADLGFRFSPSVALVGLFEYAPIFSSDVASNLLTVGGGVRFQPTVSGQLVVAAGYSNLSGGGDGTGGFAVKLIGFYPVESGFGPYLQLAYHRFSPGGGSLDLFSANAGPSFSY